MPRLKAVLKLNQWKLKTFYQLDLPSYLYHILQFPSGTNAFSRVEREPRGGPLCTTPHGLHVVDQFIRYLYTLHGRIGDGM